MMTDFSAWVGRSEEREDRLDPARSNALLAALGSDTILQVGDPLPALHHWLHFWDARTPAQTGPDGHPRKGDFLPPIPLPRRMWAGGRLDFHAPLRLGDEVRKVSTILSIKEKTGRSGGLIFVTLRHEISGGDGVAIVEEQDLVYREPAVPSADPQVPASTPDPIAVAARVEPDSVLLFRYSALTFNSHRIHYDLPYARDEEHYEGLVVQGPLQATLLADLATKRLGGQLGTFRFRGVAPAFAGHSLCLHAQSDSDSATLWASQRGRWTMSAEASRG